MAAATMYVTAAGAGDKSGSSWANAMGLAEWETDVENSAEAGDVYYVEEGTYTLTGAWSTALDGSTTAMISIIGVLSGTSNEPPVFSDHATGANRPLIAAGANSFTFDDYWHIENLRVTTTSGTGLRADTSARIVNCKSYNSSGTADREAIYITSNYSRAIACEAQSDNGTAIYLGTYGSAIACYAHDSDEGIDVGSYGAVALCVLDTCVIGVIAGAGNAYVILNNTFYTCTTGLSATTSNSVIVLNNIFDECTTPANWSTAEYKSNWFDYNSWDGDKSSNTNVTAGNHSIDTDITLGNPGNDDFSITTASDAYNAALDAGDLTGATV